jgi:hypothetical protein
MDHPKSSSITSSFVFEKWVATSFKIDERVPILVGHG